MKRVECGERVGVSWARGCERTLCSHRRGQRPLQVSWQLCHSPVAQMGIDAGDELTNELHGKCHEAREEGDRDGDIHPRQRAARAEVRAAALLDRTPRRL